MRIIKNTEIVEDAFVNVADGEDLPASGDVIVSVDRYKAERDALRARSGKVGVRLRADQAANDVLPYVDEAALVAIEFPKYTDGRGYSIARVLRERHGYKGELRAVGDVLRDQLHFMRRCGFDAYVVKAGKPLESAVQAFTEFSDVYQPAADQPLPLYRRR